MKDSFFPVLKPFFSNVPDPYTEFNKLQDSVDTLFHEIFMNSAVPTLNLLQGNYPKINVKEREKEFEIVAATPGLTKEDLTVEVSEGILKIKGESKQDELAAGDKYLYRELKKSSFIRSFSLDENIVDTLNIKSSYENGELRIILPKHKAKLEKSKVKIQID